MLIALNKPYGVLSQFSDDGSANRTLAEFGLPPNVYAIGRLDADSEGLLLLSDEGALNKKLLDPENGHPRCYWVQVEGIPTEQEIAQLQDGVVISGYRTKKCRATFLVPQPDIAARVPPIRVRKSIPDCWLEICLSEGKNRQVRRMTAAVGHPTLRLLRVSIGLFRMPSMREGEWLVLNDEQRAQVFGVTRSQPM